MKLHFNVIIFGYNDIKTWEIDPVVNFDVNKLALKVDILQQPESIYLATNHSYKHQQHLLDATRWKLHCFP